MKKWLFAVLLGTMLVLGACGGDDNADDNAANDDNATEENANDNNNAANNENDNGDSVDTAAAEDVFESNCASCHGNDLSGGAGPDLTSIGSDYDADEIADIIENGTDNGMPGGLVSGDDLDLLADWLSDMK
ncbi:MAG TPA: cytochrome c [Virgibacillus sp.]|nr:cytochrome c [Virgibacillus sp.]